MTLAIIALVLLLVVYLAVRLASYSLRLKQGLQRTRADAQAAVKLQRETIAKLRLHERLSKRRDVNHYRQIEALIELNALLGFNIRGLRSWAISPDAAVILYKTLTEVKPRLTLELGSGFSSLIIAQALKANGRGRLISIDHDHNFAAVTRQHLSEAGLAKYVEVRVARLKAKKTGRQWYDEAVVKKGLKQIDFLVVDGPPGGSSRRARQPAIPQLKHILSKRAVIFLDDFNRRDEKVAATSWLRQLPGYQLKVYETEKGTALLKPDNI